LFVRHLASGDKEHRPFDSSCDRITTCSELDQDAWLHHRDLRVLRVRQRITTVVAAFAPPGQRDQYVQRVRHNGPYAHHMVDKETR